MPEIDDLLDDPEFTGDVAHGVPVPDLVVLQRAGVRRARPRRALAAGASALAVVAVIGGVWLGAGANPDAGAPAGTPSQVPPTTVATPDGAPTQGQDPVGDLVVPMTEEPAWLAGDQASRGDFAMVLGEDTVASLWSCRRRCDGPKRALPR